jgi:hypothetical protein
MVDFLSEEGKGKEKKARCRKVTGSGEKSTTRDFKENKTDGKAGNKKRFKEGEGQQKANLCRKVAVG